MDLRQDILDTLGRDAYSAFAMTLALSKKGYSRNNTNKVIICLDALVDEGLVRNILFFKTTETEDREGLDCHSGYVKI